MYVLHYLSHRDRDRHNDTDTHPSIKMDTSFMAYITANVLVQVSFYNAIKVHSTRILVSIGLY